MKTLFPFLTLIVLVDEGKLSNLHSVSNIIKRCNRIIFTVLFPGLSLECIEGLRPHNTGKNYKVEKKFSDCGIADNAGKKKCAKSKSCAIVDVWIKGINDRPLTVATCGPEEKKDRGCEAICEKKDVDGWKTTLIENLNKYAGHLVRKL